MLTKLLGDWLLKYDNYHSCRRMLKIRKIILQSFKISLNSYNLNN